MKYGFILPKGDASVAAEMAFLAEQSGWDGFFVSELPWGVDAWISLTAAAMRTTRIYLGTMISPLSRMRPWKVASEAATLDQLSQGRVILSVGLGALETGFAAFNEITDRQSRAERLDECLEIMQGLWSGQPFQFKGKHYQVDTTLIKSSLPPPPRPFGPKGIPIWVVGAWPSIKSMSRAARWNGLLPNLLNKSGHADIAEPYPETLREMCDFIHEKRGSLKEYDIVHENDLMDSSSQKPNQLAYEQAGVTWWLESMWTEPDLNNIRTMIANGPIRS